MNLALRTVFVLTVLAALCFLKSGVPLRAGETREFSERSCSEVFSVLSASDAKESEHQRALLMNTWVRWQSSFEKKSETLWGYEVAVKCLPQGGTVSISFDSKWKPSLDKLNKGQQLEYVARVSGFNDANGIELSEGEIVPISATASRTLPPESAGIPHTITGERANIPGTSTQPERSAALPKSNSDMPIEVSQVTSFIRNYLDLWEKGSASSVLTYYATSVDYYSVGIVGLDFILKDKQNFLKKWKKLNFEIIVPVEVQHDDVSGTLSVRFTYQFSADSGKESSRGVAENFWKIKKIDGKFKILSEKQKILSRERI